jgi:thiol-disulfide isomerase/thioredoxin
MKKLIILIMALFFIIGCGVEEVETNNKNLLQDTYLGDEDKLTIYYFWGDTCPVCALQAPFLDELEENFDVQILRFEIYNNRSNQELFKEVANVFNIEPSGVPTTFIADEVFVGFNERIENQILSIVESCQENMCEEKLK